MLDKRKKVDEEHEKIGMLMIQAAIRSLKKNRRLVPTRFSITAVDDTLGKKLISEIKNFP